MGHLRSLFGEGKISAEILSENSAFFPQQEEFCVAKKLRNFAASKNSRVRIIRIIEAPIFGCSAALQKNVHKINLLRSYHCSHSPASDPDTSRPSNFERSAVD